MTTSSAPQGSLSPAVLSTGAIAIMFAAFASAYGMSYALRAVQAVLGPTLAKELQLSASALGLLSAAYFITFASIQLPLGAWLDRYGARRVEPLLLLIAAGGCIMFAMATTVSGLFVGRALIGLGVSACLMAPYSYFRVTLPAHMQPRMSSWLLMAGTAGAMCATVPVQWISQLYGWRSVFAICAGWLVLSAIAIFILVRDTAKPQTQTGVDQAAQTESGGYREVFTNATFIACAPHAFVTLGGLMALQTLWAGPWLQSVSALNPGQAANVLFLFFLSLVVTYAVQGAVLPRLTARGISLGRIAQFGAVTSCVVVIVMIAMGSAPWAVWLWPVLGVTTSLAVMMQTVVGVALPKAVAGRAFTAYNLMLFSGAFAWQWALGALIDLFKAQPTFTPVQAYQAAFAVLAVGMVAVTVWLMRLKETVIH